MSTLPAVSPGEPVCHLGKIPRRAIPSSLDLGTHASDQLHQRVQDELATNVMVVEPPIQDDEPTTAVENAERNDSPDPTS